MNEFRVITVPSFGDFVAEVAADQSAAGQAGAASLVRLCLGERYDPDRFGTGEQAFSVPARRVTLDLQGFNAAGDLVWVSEDHKVRWGSDGPLLPDDRATYQGMAALRDLVRRRLEALGYTIRPGRYVLPHDHLPLSGVFDCARWSRDGEGRIRVEPVEGEEVTP